MQLPKEFSVNSCKILLRIVLESVLNLKYMFKDDVHRNGLVFLVCTYHKDLKLCKKCLTGASSTHSSRVSFNRIKNLPDEILPPEINGLTSHIENMERMLNIPLYMEVEAEYQRLKSMGINNPAWHQLFDGPRTIENLATDLDRKGNYEVLYRGWSASVHGADILKVKFGMVDEILRQPR